MRLALSFPDDWTIKEAPGDRFAAILADPGSPRPKAIVTYGPMQVKPEAAAPWIESIARSEIAEGTTVAIGRRADRETRAGWPLHLVEVEVRGQDGELLECRVCGFFTFMEHVAAAIVRTGSREAMDEMSADLMDILESGCPEWLQKVCLGDLWDLEVGRQARTPEPLGAAAGEIRRGQEALGGGRDADALEAFEAAVEIDGGSVTARYLAGVALVGLGRKAEAARRWQEVLDLAPDSVDAHYNLGQARYDLGDFESALASFVRVTELDPDDFLSRRKVIQCLYALDRFEEGFAERKRFREQWAATTDPRAKMISEYVFDQFAGEGYTVHALETLRPKNPRVVPLLTFQAVAADDTPLTASVVVETSAKARAAGTPFVIGVTARGKFEVVSLMKDLPTHGVMRDEVRRLLDEALRSDG